MAASDKKVEENKIVLKLNTDRMCWELEYIDKIIKDNLYNITSKKHYIWNGDIANEDLHTIPFKSINITYKTKFSSQSFDFPVDRDPRKPFIDFDNGLFYYNFTDQYKMYILSRNDYIVTSAGFVMTSEVTRLLNYMLNKDTEFVYKRAELANAKLDHMLSRKKAVKDFNKMINNFKVKDDGKEGTK